MKKVLLLILLVNIIMNDPYDEIINEEVSEEYCNWVIGNITSLLNEGYIYLDFLKAPKQPEGKENYVIKVDLISELNSINKKNRKFYDFYADIQNVLNKARDGHLSITNFQTPKFLYLDDYYFCIPFSYKIQEVFDENNTFVEAFLTIQSFYGFFCNNYSKDILDKINHLQGKKILKINNLDPYKYFEEMSKRGPLTHCLQSQFLDILETIYELSLDYYPLKKEELNVSIQFEGEEEEFKIEYQFEEYNYFSQEFKEYYLSEKKNYFKKNIPFPKFKEMELKFKIKKGLINQRNLNLIDEDDFWQFKSNNDEIKCRVDKDNNLNVLYQNSFYPINFDNYEDIMYKCFSTFYSNDYNIIIIEDRNGGGKTELCYPFTQYVSPKINKPTITALKSTQLLLKTFFLTDEMLNPETCFPYTEKDNILDGKEEIYNDGIDQVTHKKTKDIDSFNIYEKKIMEKKRKEYLLTGKTKKPTEILVFTDGYSFSCASDFIRGLQVKGHGIMVGYNSRPGLNKSDFDASQSNSGVEEFRHSKIFEDLKELGFLPSVTYTEKFDPNDKDTSRMPMEFKIYPVDEIVDIYIKYDDEIYNRFIDEAKLIFNKYNNLENGECNPDNKLLYYETNECDAFIKIDNAHGGYLCGSNGKWNTSNCIAAYCDQGYILNDERTKCIRDPCQDITLKEISLNAKKDLEYIIEPNKTYIFSIEKENYSYYFYSEFEKFFYLFNRKHVLEAVKNGTEFKINNKIYVNYYVNITKNTTIKIKAVNLNPDDSDNPDSDNPDSDNPDSDNPDDSDKPDSDKPDSDKPDSDNPDSDNPDSDKPDSDKPDSDKPDSDKPDSDKPDSDKPDSDNPDSDNPDSDNGKNDKQGISTGIIVLIVIASIIVLISIAVIIFLFQKKKQITNREIEKKTHQLDSILI